LFAAYFVCCIAAGNETLRRMHETLRWQSAADLTPDQWGETVKVHKNLLHALRLRDGDVWALVVRHHVQARAADKAARKPRHPRPRPRVPSLDGCDQILRPGQIPDIRERPSARQRRVWACSVM
jgi:hypothetical protein